MINVAVDSFSLSNCFKTERSLSTKATSYVLNNLVIYIFWYTLRKEATKLRILYFIRTKFIAQLRFRIADSNNLRIMQSPSFMKT